MKLHTEGNAITICGANAGYMLLGVVFALPLALMGSLLIVALLLAGGTSVWIQIVLWATLISMLMLIFLLPYIYWQARSNCVSIDRERHNVTITGKRKVADHVVGTFLKVVIQPVSIPRGGLQYHAILVGVEGEAPLGLVAGTAQGLQKKVRPVLDFLGIPIEMASTTKNVFEVIAQDI